MYIIYQYLFDFLPPPCQHSHRENERSLRLAGDLSKSVKGLPHLYSDAKAG